MWQKIISKMLILLLKISAKGKPVCVRFTLKLLLLSMWRENIVVVALSTSHLL